MERPLDKCERDFLVSLDVGCATEEELHDFRLNRRRGYWRSWERQWYADMIEYWRARRTPADDKNWVMCRHAGSLYECLKEGR